MSEPFLKYNGEYIVDEVIPIRFPEVLAYELCKEAESLGISLDELVVRILSARHKNRRKSNNTTPRRRNLPPGSDIL